nr:acetate/propionate family kinase [Shimia biformata]
MNAGSSSVKFAVYGEGAAPLVKGQIERIGNGPRLSLAGEDRELPLAADAGHDQIIGWLLDHLGATHPTLSISAAGHRVVHGGQAFDRPARVTDDVLVALEALAPLAPAHQPHNLAGIRAVAAKWPDVPQVACFDSAFHRTQPRLAQMFPIPRDLTDQGVLRYGFHGLSYDFIASQLPDHLAAAERERVLVLHLGNGASICAMRDLQSVATTMGFTAIDGLMMGRRCGQIDPGVIFHLAREGRSVGEIEALLSKDSGLLGVSGLSSDMRDLLASDDPRAKEAVDLFVYSAARQIGSLAAALGGVDAIVFTGGIGENAAPVRAAITQSCGWLGAELDGEANDAGRARISSAASRVAVLALKTDEEGVIACYTRAMAA